MMIFGSEPQIYLYADCEAASGHVFMYPVVDGSTYSTRLQDEVIAEVSEREPRFLVYINLSESWLNQDPSDRLVRWMQGYVNDHYYPIGIVDILSDRTLYNWDEDARTYPHRATSEVFVFERRGRDRDL